MKIKYCTVCFVGISAGKNSQQGRCLRGSHNLSITGQCFLFLLPACFYNRVDWNCILQTR